MLLHRCPGVRSGEHQATRLLHRCKGGKAGRDYHVVVDRFHAAAREIDLVPEAGPFRIAQKVLPPLLMRKRAGPLLQRLDIAPVLSHAGVRREEEGGEILMREQSVRPRGHRLADGWSQLHHSPQSPAPVDPQPEIDHDQSG